jgi:hypothetical protein
MQLTGPWSTKLPGSCRGKEDLAMKRIILLTILVHVFASVAYAGLDTFKCDTAIYGYTGTTGVRPNILFIIDNSNAAANKSVGMKYDNTWIYEGVHAPWDIYENDQQGEFKHINVKNETDELEKLMCSDGGDVIKTTLLKYRHLCSSGYGHQPWP